MITRKWLLWLVLVFAWFSCRPAVTLAQEPVVARVVKAVGKVYVSRGREVPQFLVRGVELYSGDRLITENGELIIRFTDGMRLILYRDTRFSIDDFHFHPEKQGSDRARFTLIEGVISKKTGQLSGRSAHRFQLKTHMAILGIRGTGFHLLLKDVLHLSVVEGSVFLEHANGVTHAGAGKHLHMPHAEAVPVAIDHPVPIHLHRHHPDGD